MATLIPTSQPTGVEAYEDMFKEITRKLYGDESGHGLYPHNTQVAQVAQLASGAPAAPEGGERSFTTLVSDRNIAQIDYETTTVQIQQQQQQGGGAQQQQSGGTFKSEEHLTTAFGLAALMQNGFPPPGAILNPVNFPVGTTLKPSTNIAIATADDRWQQQTQQTQPQDQQQQSVGQDHTWTPNGKQSSSSSYSQKAFKKPKIEPQDGSPTGTIGTVSTLNIPQTGSDKNKANFGSAAVGAATGKRYSCTSCPYTTDRRDLFTRHENIHKEEKPFHCYACLKQFNRADHVKKHFLRMHRDMEYEIAKTRKSVNAKNNYYNNNTSASSSGNNATVSTTVTQSLAPQPTTIIQTSNNTLNIPTATFPTQITIPTHHGNAIEHTVSHDIATLNGVVHHVQQQQQQQHQHQQQQQSAPPPHQPTQIVLGPPIVTIKQEKGGAITTTTTTATAAAVAAATAIVNNSAQQQRGDIVATAGPEELLPNDDKSLVKKLKGEKRFTCCYCPWSGADNWGLKRHLNTHTKPFVCMLCDYKAARSERLATHVFKVHNKKACNKCNYFADDETQLNTHLLEAHPHDANKPQPKTTTVVIQASGGNGGVVVTQNPPTVLTAVATTSIPTSTGTGNVLRNLGNTFVTNNVPGSVSGNSFGTTTNTNIYHTITTSATTGNILTNSNASNLIDTINAHLAQQTVANSAGGGGGGAGVSTVINPGNGIGGGVAQVVITNGQQHHLHQQQQQQPQQQQQQQQQPQQSTLHQSSQSQSQPQQQQQTTHHWIAKVNRKRGAELLYSYLEADGSDSEDYARLLNMQAIGRNKASVTQDFHNAGGGNQHHHFSNSHSSTNGTNKLSLLVAASSSASCSPSGSPSPPLSRLSPPTMVPLSTTTTTTQAGGGGAKIPIANGMAMANLTEEHLSLLQLLATAAVAQQHLQQQQQQLQQKNATSTSISTSPPANHPHQQPNNYNHHQNSTNSNVTSDPANNNGSKQRRRKSSSRNDKENLVQRHPTATVVPGGKVIDLTTGSTTHGTTNGPAENGIERNNNGSSNNNNSSVNNKNINEAIFDRVYKKPYNMFLTSAFCKPSPIEKDRAAPKDENFSLSEFLRNHKEVSISTLSDVRPVKPRGVALDGGPVDEDDVIFIKEEKRLGRKQQQPRRNLALDTELNASPLNISYKPPSGTTPDRPQIGDIRDKHMIRLISRKLCCRICQNQQRLEHMDNCHYHSKTSLILHNRWRHGSWPRTEHCKLCRASFDRKYKLVLHLRLQHTRRRLSPLALKSKSKSKKDPSGHKRKATSGKKQQRKRKSKSRSGSKHGTVKRRK